MRLPPLAPNTIYFEPAIPGLYGGGELFLHNHVQNGGSSALPPPMSGSVVEDDFSGGDCAECGCAHDRQGLDNSITCYTKPELDKIAKKSGIKEPEKKVEIVLAKEIKAKKQGECGNDQACWAGNDNSLEKAFKPIAPKGKYTWLNTTNIKDVAEQWEKSHPDFEYLGTVPIDFEEVDSTFRNFDIRKQLKKGKTKFGAVFNTDYSTGRGKHWIAMFGDLDKKEINYFDSYANNSRRPPPTQITAFASKLKEQGKKLNGFEHLTYNQNETVFQRANSECGVFSLYFLKKSLDGVPFKDFQKQPIHDEEVNQYRKNKGLVAFFRDEAVPVGI